MGSDADFKKAQLLSEFETGKLPLLEFMRSAKRLSEECGGFSHDQKLGKAVVASFGRHTEGRDLMACILGIEGFDVIVADRDTQIPEAVEMCTDPEVHVLCLSVQTTYDCPELDYVDSLLKDAGIRNRIIFNAGGAAMTPGLAEKVGCDVYGQTAVQSVRMIKERVFSL